MCWTTGFDCAGLSWMRVFAPMCAHPQALGADRQLDESLCGLDLAGHISRLKSYDQFVFRKTPGSKPDLSTAIHISPASLAQNLH